MGVTTLDFKSKGMTNRIRIQSGKGIPQNVIGIFSDETVGNSVGPDEVRCFKDRGILSLGAMHVYLDDAALEIVHTFLTAQFKVRGIYWGC